ncbi:MAG: hypothetical protein IJU44_03825 [Kiritimatiellae bacterium]|nr:hypothetical protein [Kiritimatiellia bacterium]
MTLKEWQQKNLPQLRKTRFEPAKHAGVTLVCYLFPPTEREREYLEGIECALLQSWKVLGQLPAVLVASHRFPELDELVAARPQIGLQVEPALTPGSIRSMSLDCITKLADRFSTEYCLVIQNDGFPLRDTLADFLGKWDYIGAPANVGWRRRFLFKPFGVQTFNGGFSLRSRKICRAAAAAWRLWGRWLIGPRGRLFAEDVFYTTTAKFFCPRYRFAHRFPDTAEARRFAYDDLSRHMDLPPSETPFGFHGTTTAEHYL